MNYKSILQKFGLSEKEVNVYVASLEIGSSTVQKIAEKTNLPRSTVYEVLKNLRKKSLVSTFSKKNIKHFYAQEPEYLTEIAQENLSNLKKILPDLNAIYGNAKNRPRVRFYQGTDGMKIILKEILSEANELLAYASVDHLFALLGEHFEHFVKERIKKKIPVKVICCQKTIKGMERKNLGPRQLREVKFLNGDFMHEGLLFIWKEKMAMFSFTGEQVAVLTESKELTQIQKTMFMYLWNIAR